MRTFNGVAVAVVAVLLAGGCTPPMPVLEARFDTMSGESLREAVSRLSFGECETLPRTAAGTAPGVTRLQICAVDGGQHAGGSNTPTNGVPVARIVNKGSLPDKRWELNPGPYESWIFVYGPAPAKYALMEISTLSSTDPPRTIVMSGEYHHCGHVKGPPRARARFGRCQDNPGSRPPESAPSALGRGLNELRSFLLPPTAQAQPALSLDGPAWIDCGGDCCTTETI